MRAMKIWSWVKRGVLLTMIGLGVACDPAPPSIVELSTPRGSIDALGPYAFTARTRGATDRVVLSWRVKVAGSSGEAEETGEEQEEVRDTLEAWNDLPLRPQGEVWVADLEGGHPVATYEFFLRAIGPGGTTREPISGVDRFEVVALTGTCAVDADCLTGELCHRDEGYCFVAPERCQADFQCPRDQVCNLQTNLCRFTDHACESSEECEVGSECEDGRCVPIRIEPPPPPPPLCEPACGEQEECVEGTCVFIRGCRLDTDCPEESACDVSKGICALGKRGRFCSPCGLESSAFSADCGVGYGCLEGLSGCRPLCGSNGNSESACGLDEICVEGLCIIPDFPICLNWECVNHIDCSGGLCERGRCTPAQDCADNGECGERRSCQNGVCTFLPECEYESCPEGSICLGGLCELNSDPIVSCTPCSRDQECGRLGHCYFDPFISDQGMCLQLCERDYDCYGGQECLQLGVARFCADPQSYYLCEGVEEACGRDEFEPNQEAEASTLLPLLEERSYFREMRTCNTDVDWFVLNTQDDWRYRFLWKSDGPTQLVLYDEDLNAIDVTISFGEYIATELQDARYIEVIGLDPVEVTYQFAFEVILPLTECALDDAFEENDSLDESYPIGIGAELSLTICPEDADWFSFRPRFTGEVLLSWLLQSYIPENLIISFGTQEDFYSGSERSVFAGLVEGELMVSVEEGRQYYIRLTCEWCSEVADYQLYLSAQ